MYKGRDRMNWEWRGSQGPTERTIYRKKGKNQNGNGHSSQVQLEPSHSGRHREMERRSETKDGVKGGREKNKTVKVFAKSLVES